MVSKEIPNKERHLLSSHKLVDDILVNETSPQTNQINRKPRRSRTIPKRFQFKRPNPRDKSFLDFSPFCLLCLLKVLSQVGLYQTPTHTCQMKKVENCDTQIFTNILKLLKKPF